jgi:hypothetical protein
MLRAILFCLIFIHSYGLFVYDIEHSINGGQFFSRGTVELHYNPSAGGKNSVSFSNAVLSKEDIENLVASTAQDGYYRLRISLPNQQLMSAVPACAFLASNLREVIFILSFQIDLICV